MTSIPAISLPPGGSLLADLDSLLPSESRACSTISLTLPAGMDRVELRSLTAWPDLLTVTAPEQPDGRFTCSCMPLPEGSWARITLPIPAQNALRLRLSFGGGAIPRFLILRTGCGPAAASFSDFGGWDLPPPVQPPYRAVDPRGPEEIAKDLATQLRAGELDMTLAALARLPTGTSGRAANLLLGYIADDPGDAPTDLLPFLLLLARS